MELVYPVGTTAAITWAAKFLKKYGVSIIDHPAPEVTHLLMDVPSFDVEGNLRGGGKIEEILERLPPYIRIIGGNLEHPALEGYEIWDLLKHEEYLAENAAITADCAIRVAAPLLETTFAHSPALIIGWGRIGKVLARYLQGLGCPVTVAARKEKDRAMLQASGIPSVEPEKIFNLEPFRIVFNTAPEPVLGNLRQDCNCVKIDLASKKGLAGDDVIWARGLPGKYAPESSGSLIAKVVLDKIQEERK